MNAPVTRLLATDPRWAYRSSIEVATAGFNSDALGVGSSPYQGDMAGTGLLVPATPTADQAHRYLFRLAAIQIPQGRAVILRGLRQLATIRQIETIQPDELLRPVELEITTPTWSFVDGNISWHLRFQPTAFGLSAFDAAQTPGTSPHMNSFDPALLYVPPLVPYAPPGGGVPPGCEAEHLGTWRDIRYPWNSSQFQLEQLIQGPGVVALYASVHQTNPEGRPILVVADPGALSPEDRFLQTFQSAIYGRVAGAMRVETLPSPEFTP